ncbi:dihydropyrimidinase [Microvirga mediterraneensis]|uniref:Dihydropyrimidinase n=1 Tax=Microvirga mediterraneensis TaxID=2754695 RepID=A0A838BMG0_9HYPH|nr:dihydropyrimidinase [Microvirga mediterraneensis]MBA1156002.1 dihydropyrimidinase [Microvirga mediterraneensis]
MAEYDLVIKGGRVATTEGVSAMDVAIQDGEIAALGRDLQARASIDAAGKFVLPGGVDAHCHIEQLSGGGLMNADTFETATRSAAFGGTTTVISFAAQHRGDRLRDVVESYARLAAAGAVTDYAFHLWISDPTPETLEQDLPRLIEAGHRSIKVFMTYDRVRLLDEQVLDVMMVARKYGALVCAHAENHGMIKWMADRLIARGYVEPKFHGVSHPRVCEIEAFERLIRFSQLLDQPVMLFHVSTAEGAAVVRRARGEGIKVFAETCPQYLFLTAQDLDRPDLEGAKWMCSPPPRTTSDQEALWRGLELGDLQIISSDHAPYRFDESGKLAAGANPDFKQIANGLPGLETRLPLLFDAMVSQGRSTIEKFVELTATAPAKIYGLHPRKGAIAVGADADIAIWDPDREVVLQDDGLHDNVGYNPFAGRRLKGWPETVLRRGETIIGDGRLQASPGSGRLQLRGIAASMRPTGRLGPEFDPSTNFGAQLL